jgi:proto-oncogene tyrosine-protein kinase Ret
MSTRYETCSTDLEFCPDQFCDPLEELYSLICPQDCTSQYFYNFYVILETLGLYTLDDDW